MNGALNTSVNTGEGKTYEQTVLLPDLSRLPDSRRAALADRKYAGAVAMYASTEMPLCRIAEVCGVTAAGLSAHIGRYHRHLLYARYGLEAESSMPSALKVKSPRGQSISAHLKYKDAIEACGDIAYIEYNVSGIARMFGLDGTALAAQLRVHYPDFIPARELLRSRLGFADNIPRGARPSSVAAYGEAIGIYRDSDLTIPEVAGRCNVSRGGLVQFMRFYHHDIIDARAVRRSSAAADKSADRQGRKSGNGRPYGPRPETVALYAPALELYLHSSASISEIAASTGVPPEGFRSYLAKWHSEARRRHTTRPSASARDKYSLAIASLRQQPRPVARVAAEFGLNPDLFRQYLKAHEPALAASRGMTLTDGGRKVSSAAAGKYSAAVAEYASSPDSLRTIAGRHGINYKSLSAYVNRNCPGEKQRHADILASASLNNDNETNQKMEM